jgi:hypothetical protein
MRKFIYVGAFLSGLAAHADLIEYDCHGGYDSKQVYSPYDPSTVSVSADLQAQMLGDENAEGEYTLVSAKLTMRAVNHHDVDAGSFDVKNITGELNQAHKAKFKNYIRFDLGSNLGQAYTNTADAPETYLLIPAGDSNVVYIQRSGSGHDVYPTIRLLCR